jgi:hypothetical protein
VIHDGNRRNALGVNQHSRPPFEVFCRVRRARILRLFAESDARIRARRLCLEGDDVEGDTYGLRLKEGAKVDLVFSGPNDGIVVIRLRIVKRRKWCNVRVRLAS